MKNRTVDPSVPVIAFGETADRRTFVGPVFEPGETACRDCLARRASAAGAIDPGSLRFEPLTSMIVAEATASGIARRVLRDRAAERSPGGRVERRLFVPPQECECARAARVAGTQAALSEAVSDLFGLVRHVEEISLEDGLTLAVAYGAATIGTSGAPALAFGSATHRSPQRARSLAIAEALERYSAAFWRPDHLHEVPRAYDGSDPAEPRPSFWVEAKVCGSCDVTLVPATQVYLPFTIDHAQHSQSSAGLAAGDSAESALERALAERVERDVLADFTSGRRAAIIGLTTDRAFLVLLGREVGYEIWIAAEFRDTAPYCVIGLGGARDGEEARDKARRELRHVAAHMELVACNYWGKHLRVGGDLDRLIFRLASDRKVADRYRALLERAPARENGPADPNADRLRAAVDVTSSDLRAFGLHVCRVVTIPQLGKGPTTVGAPLESGNWFERRSDEL